MRYRAMTFDRQGRKGVLVEFTPERWIGCDNQGKIVGCPGLGELPKLNCLQEAEFMFWEEEHILERLIPGFYVPAGTQVVYPRML